MATYCRDDSLRLTDRIMSVSAIVAAIAAVVVAAYEARLIANTSVSPSGRASSNRTVSFPGEPYLRTVSNVGVGPALIRSVQVSVDGVPRRTWGEVIRALIGKPAPGHVYSSFHAGAVVLSDKPVTILKIPPGDDAQKFWEETQGQRLSIRICYSSLYEECWLADSLDGQPRSVAECRLILLKNSSSKTLDPARHAVASAKAGPPRLPALPLLLSLRLLRTGRNHAGNGADN